MLVNQCELLWYWIEAEAESVKAKKEYRTARLNKEKAISVLINKSWYPKTKAEAEVMSKTELYKIYNEKANNKDEAESKAMLMKAVYYDARNEYEEWKQIDINASLLWKKQDEV